MIIGYFGTHSKQFEVCYDKETGFFDTAKEWESNKRFNFFTRFSGFPECFGGLSGKKRAIKYAIDKTKEHEEGITPLLIEVHIPQEEEIKKGLIGKYINKTSVRVYKCYEIIVKRRRFRNKYDLKEIPLPIVRMNP